MKQTVFKVSIKDTDTDSMSLLSTLNNLHIYIKYIYIYIQLLKVGNKLLLHTLTCSILRRAILTGEIATHKFTKILFRYSQYHAWW